MRRAAFFVLAVVVTSSSRAAPAPGPRQIAAYFRPFAATNNLSGSVLVMRHGKPLFARSYGFADQSRRIRNGPETRFHIASMSILFTSTAVLRLIDQGKLSFDTRVSEIVPGVPNGDKITIRNLLLQNSNLPDVNDDLPDEQYQALMNRHETPQSLVDAIRSLPPQGEPGGDSQREEHSGQNLLALIIEKKTGLPFADAMQQLVFRPFGMRNSGIDDDRQLGGRVAKGYRVSGTFGLTPAPSFHWSAKPGNGSAYTTVGDEWKWLQGLQHGPLLSDSSRKAMLETEDGFGWNRSKKQSPRLGETVMISNGRAPGFSAILEYLPEEDVAVIVLTNIEHDANPLIVPEATAMIMGKSYKPFDYRPVPPKLSGKPADDFTFGPDFYRKNATLKLASDAKGTTLYWPGGPEDPLLPIASDKYIDRYYWSPVTLIRDSWGKPIELDFSGFKGMRRSQETKQ
jgi:CubicO group peptidase (beta-lactamase class C family)